MSWEALQARISPVALFARPDKSLRTADIVLGDKKWGWELGEPQVLEGRPPDGSVLWPKAIEQIGEKRHLLCERFKDYQSCPTRKQVYGAGWKGWSN